MKLAKSQIFIIVINSILFLIGFVLMFSFSVKAESVDVLPYVVPEYRSLNSFVSDTVIEEAINYYYSNLPSNVTVNSFMIYAGPYTNTYDFAYRIYFITNPTVQSGISPHFDFLQNDLLVTSNDFAICDVILGTDLSFQGFEYNISQSTRLLGVPNTVVQNNGGNLTDNYVYYYSGPDIYSARIDGGEPVLIFTNNTPYSPSIPNQGHATQPTNNPNNFINGSNNLPIGKPTFPTINYYSYTTYAPPSIDNSNIESLLESIYDLIQYNLDYQTSNFVGQWSNLLNNMGNLTDYIVKSFENGFNKVVLSIQDLVTDLYNNFVSLFEPITTQINYIVSPIDTDFIVSGISETEFYNGFEDTKDFFYTVDTIFDIQEPDYFIIEIHLEDLDFFDSGLLDFNLSTVYLNLGSNILPFRNALRVFLWCMVSVGTVFYVQKNLPSMIKGDEVGGTGDAK